jgi:putative transposase
VFVERLWRTVKYEEVYLKSYVSLVDAHAQLDRFFRFYNERRPHSSLDGATPPEIHQATIPVAANQ